MKTVKIFVFFITFTITLFIQSCVETEETCNKFDFSCFIEEGLTDNKSKKFLTYINFHRGGADYTGLKFVCDMYVDSLKKYKDSQTHDILFLIEAHESDSLELKEYLEDWCFDNYLVTYTTPDFYLFKNASQNNVGAISYLLDKNGEKISVTNPSLPNFHELMTE